MDSESSARDLLEHIVLDANAEPTHMPRSLLYSITDNFSIDRLIGSGGFADVYKGVLQNGGTIAVKKLTQTLGTYETKFHQEIDSLMRVKHVNIVRFLGYCSDTQGKVWKLGRKNVIAEDRQRFLCFEFLSGGSLDKYINDASQGLEWIKRYHIIKGICEGLHYLHQQNIVHLDLKPANILLDHDMVPKIADFGLSKCFDENQTQTMTSHVIGTWGYMAPEYYGGLVTLKSDIYSLGMIIIEILTGHKGYPEIENVLGSWSARFETSLGDARLEPIRQCAEIGIECIESNPAKRPDTRCIIKRIAEMERKYGLAKPDLLLASSATVTNRSTKVASALAFAQLNHSTVSFAEPKPETAASRWNRVTLNASKVGQGLSRDGKAPKLAFQHWIEAMDPRHRYGRNLYFYYDVWCQSQASQPFFYWLDVGEGKDVDLPDCPRTLLRKQCIKYLGSQERENYEYIINEGKIIHKLSGELLDTSQDKWTRWIFVMSTAKRLYAGKKEKGVLQHSSFLRDGATIAAGRFTAKGGAIKSIWAYSGHYKPIFENLSNFMNFLQDNGVDLKEVEVGSLTKEDYYDDPVPSNTQNLTAALSPQEAVLPPNITEGNEGENAPAEQAKPTYERTLSGGLQSPKSTEVPQKAILERMKSKGETKSYELGHRLSLKWCTGAGPRIGCVRDYPMELRAQAMEMVEL